MIEVDLYNYWTKSLSVNELSKLKDCKVVYDIKSVILLMLLILFFLLLIFTLLFSLMPAFYRLIDVLICFLIASGLVIIFLQFGKKTFNCRRLVNRCKEDVNIYELKESCLKNYIETKYLDRKKDATEFYRVLIHLCEKKGNYEKLSMSFFYALIGVVLTLYAFLFDSVKGLENRSRILDVTFVLIFCAVSVCLIIKVHANKPQYTYSNLADALSRILIKSRMKKMRK